MSLAQRLAAQIQDTGPLSVAHYMAACLYDPHHGYYATRPRIGGHDKSLGDFITAPEISQMFGELIGLWCVHEWDALARPDPLRWIELGPGNGALISDAWRASRIAPDFQQAAHIHLVEVSPALREAQAIALAHVRGHAASHAQIAEIPDGPSLIVANEFFDCLPIRQFVRADNAWRERLVGIEAEGALAFGLGPPQQDIGWRQAEAEDGAIVEIAPALPAFVDAIAQRLKHAPGRALIIDYAGDGVGDTLQAVRAHQKEHPLANPGEADLTARVDFTALKILARASGLDVAGPIGQGDFLRALGLDQRAQGLTHKHPARAERIAREHHRLTAPDQMGALFQVLCLSSPNLPPPAGF